MTRSGWTNTARRFLKLVGIIGAALLLIIAAGVSYLAWVSHDVETNLDDATRLVNAGDIRKAIQLLRRLDADYAWFISNAQHAKVLYLLGRSYHESELDQEALGSLDRAFPLFLSARDDYGSAKTLELMGDIYGARKQTSYAVGVYRLALRRYEGLGESFATGLALLKLGDRYWEIGLSDAATGEWTQALRQFTTAGLSEYEAGTGKRLTTAQTAGNNQLASILSRATTARAHADLSAEAVSLMQLGALYDNRDELLLSAHNYERALDVGTRGGDTATVAHVMNELALLYTRAGQPSMAEPLYRHARELWHGLAEYDNEAMTLRDLANMLERQGRRPDSATQAYDALQESLAMSRQIGNRSIEAAILRTLGQWFLDHGDLSWASTAGAQASQLARDAGEPLVLRDADVLQQRIARARPQGPLPTGTPGSSTGVGTDDVVAELRSSETQSTIDELNSPSFNDSEQAWRDELAATSAQGDLSLSGKILVELAKRAEADNRLEDAFQDVSRSINTYESTRQVREISPFVNGASLYDMVWHRFQLALDYAKRLNRPSDAFYLSERSRSRALLDHIGASNVQAQASSSDSGILAAEANRARADVSRIRLDLMARDSEQASEKQQAAATGSLEQLRTSEIYYDAIRERQRVAGNEWETFAGAQPSTLENVQAGLDADTTLLVYDQTERETFLFVVTKGSLDLVTLPLTGRDLISIFDFRKFGDRSTGWEGPMRDLYTRLLQPARHLLHTRKLGVVPTTALAFVPFAALHDGSDFLGNQFTIFYLPSASVLEHVAREAISNRSVLAVANSEPLGLPGLPSANGEARSVASIFGGEVLTGPDATKDRVLPELQKSNTLHFAAHADVSWTVGGGARILLTPSLGDDGVLSPAEIRSLNLRTVDLVVLSACDSSLGPYVDGEGFLGFAHAFLWAGASTVVSSLWKVDDAVSSQLMVRYYRALGDGLGKAEALRRAQTEVRDTYPSPYYWAAFQLTGDPGTSPHEAASPSAQQLSLVIAVVGVIAAIGARVHKRGSFAFIGRQRHVGRLQDPPSS